MTARRLAVLAMTALLLSGCIGLPLRAARQARSSGGVPIAITGDTPPPSDLSKAAQDIVKRGAEGVTVIVMKEGKSLYRLDAGKITPDTRYLVASATKWLTAALMMSLVDDGILSLDEPVSALLPDFKGPIGATTLRQLLAQTSGEGGLKGRLDIRQDPRITLARSAAEVAAKPLEDPPGAVFKYGGPSFQVAGALAEAATGKRWTELWEERIGRPLGMSRTTWQHEPDHGVPPEQTLNPLLQGGVVTTADDYMRFLTMLAGGGVYQGKRILSEQAVTTLETAQTLGKKMAYEPPGVPDGWQYALGNWCESWENGGNCTMVSSPGAYGTFPWIDRKSGLYGIFFLHERLPKVSADIVKGRAAILAAPR